MRLSTVYSGMQTIVFSNSSTGRDHAEMVSLNLIMFIVNFKC